MKLGTQSYFCSKKGTPTCKIDIYKDSAAYPIVIYLENQETATRIHMYLQSTKELIRFKNSFLDAFDKVMREAEDA